MSSISIHKKSSNHAKIIILYSKQFERENVVHGMVPYSILDCFDHWCHCRFYDSWDIIIIPRKDDNTLYITILR